MSKRALVAFYSRSGNTRALADEIRQAVQADVEEITEPARRDGASGFIRSLLDSLMRREPPIHAATRDPAEYDVLLLGGPVWAGRMAAPVRTYASRYGPKAAHVAFFCTEGGRGADTAFADLRELCKHPPEATLAIEAARLAPEKHHDDLVRFTQAVNSMQRH